MILCHINVCSIGQSSLSNSVVSSASDLSSIATNRSSAMKSTSSNIASKGKSLINICRI